MWRFSPPDLHPFISLFVFPGGMDCTLSMESSRKKYPPSQSFNSWRSMKPSPLPQWWERSWKWWFWERHPKLTSPWQYAMIGIHRDPDGDFKLKPGLLGLRVSGSYCMLSPTSNRSCSTSVDYVFGLPSLIFVEPIIHIFKEFFRPSPW